MYKKLLLKVLALGMCLGLWASPASAGVVEWNNATFQIDLLNFTGNRFSFHLTADFTGFAEVDQTGHFDYLIGVNFKPSQGNLVDSSMESTSADGVWVYNTDTNLSSSNTNCANSPGNNNFFCAANIGNATLNPTSGNPIYTWDFTLAINGVTAGQENLLTANTPLRALFTDGPNSGYQTSLMSQTTGGNTQVPEPATLSLLAFGLAGCVFGKSRTRVA